ncbi:hypothetical protein Droror1_Dr00009972 [Drosera rotundifolia]
MTNSPQTSNKTRRMKSTHTPNNISNAKSTNSKLAEIGDATPNEKRKREYHNKIRDEKTLRSRKSQLTAPDAKVFRSVSTGGGGDRSLEDTTVVLLGFCRVKKERGWKGM